ATTNRPSLRDGARSVPGSSSSAENKAEEGRGKADGNIDFDAVIIAAPSWVAGSLLAEIDPALSAKLASIEHSGTAVVSLGYNDNQIAHPLNAMGAVVPAVERSPILAVSFSSRKYAHRAPAGKTLLRIFTGGACHPEMIEMQDDALLKLVRQHTEKLLGISGEPVFCDLAHWPRTMPQYHVGHNELVSEIESGINSLVHLQLAGNAYHGVGIPDCIHSGELAAEKILGSLS
ncbi:MAG: protoporphyrinogen oxidase, partial [Thermoguttaceae bacterium]